MKSQKFNQIVGRLQGMKNSLTGDAKDFAEAVLAGFEELANDEQEHTVEDLAQRVEDIRKDFASKEDVQAEVAEVKESILRVVRNMKGTPEQTVSAKAAREVCNVMLHAKGKMECMNALREVAERNGIELKKKENDLTGLSYQELVDYSLNIKQDDSDEVFDALHPTPFGTLFFGELSEKEADNIAKQWDKSAAAGVVKEIQKLAVQGKNVLTRYIYKMLRIANEDIDSAEEAGQEAALIASGRAELRKSVKSLAVRAMLIGDTVNEEGKKITTFETVGTKTKTDVFTTVLNPEDSEVTLADILRLVKSVKTSRKWLFISSAMEVKLRTMVYAAGGTTVIIGADELAKMVGVEKIVNKDYLDEVDGLLAIVIDPDEYWVKTKKTLDITFPEYRENSNYLLYEMNMGGAIHGIQSTAVLRAASSDDDTTE